MTPGCCLGWQTLEKQKGIEVLKEACAACGEAITARKGRMIVKDEARVVRCPRHCGTCWFGLEGVQEF